MDEDSEKKRLRNAKAMRSNPTPAEARLWYKLRAKRLNGVKFTRQDVIGNYIVDFVARERRLIIEVDGDTHAASAEYDAKRTAWLKGEGYQVIRFANADVIGNEEGVLTLITVALSNSPSPRPSPQRGEGEEE
ncbi:endonuclease domain-containing protein [uncultured Sphingomonas sp.]|uniref:endonuclease domain-containing protein n=1 Tax=uncultured Sphingomonas sp. TaxID=158754 RepID=UPI0035CAFCF5